MEPLLYVTSRYLDVMSFSRLLPWQRPYSGVMVNVRGRSTSVVIAGPVAAADTVGLLTVTISDSGLVGATQGVTTTTFSDG